MGKGVTSHKSEGEFDLGQSSEPTVVSSSHIAGSGFESRKSAFNQKEDMLGVARLMATMKKGTCET
jgi:hypothetical protein